MGLLDFGADHARKQSANWLSMEGTNVTQDL
jgi:hypothetical protein